VKCPHCDGTGQLNEATFGALVIQARMAAGLTQHEAAMKAAISRGQLANIETDRTDVPLKTLLRIAEALGVEPKDLLP
jgi:transcriptional regulator with XRE-family HTH domain